MRGWTAFALFAVTACGGGGGGPSIDDFFPPLPPTGGATGAFARPITDASDLVTGPAAQGLVGDTLLGNERVHLIIQAPGRAIGVVPAGGNLIDAVPVDASGAQTVGDQFGELTMFYKLGRTCDHQTIEIVRDGSEGGPAVVRARGVTTPDDYVDLKGIPAIPVDPIVDPDVDDRLECATTYVLAPGARTLQIYWTLFNPTTDRAQGPMGSLADTGGVVDVWGDTQGFGELGINAITSLGDKAPMDYAVYQGPDVAYGLVPRSLGPQVNAQFSISGVSILAFGVDSLVGLIDRQKYYVVLDQNQGKTAELDVVVGRDASDADAVYRDDTGQATTPIAGTVAFAGGGAPAGARVGVYLDADGDGQIGDADPIVSYLDADASGAFAGRVPAAGNHLLRAEVKDVGRSAAAPASGSVALTIPRPVTLDYAVVDDETGAPIPARLLVLGPDAVFPDKRVFPDGDRLPGVVQVAYAIRGTSVGGDADAPFVVPAGTTYRVYASRGPEWSIASQAVVADHDQEIDLRLRRELDTTGYLATEWHVHQVGSPDAITPSDVRVKTAVAGGVEMFAVTDHDYVSDLEPIVKQLGVDQDLRVVPGEEVTPFAYGHFQAFPMSVDLSSPSHGAVDWGRGMAGFSMVPSEIFAAARARGAQCVQVNHPRGTPGVGNFQQFFDRADLQFDYANRTIFGDFGDAPVPNALLRLPDESLWSDQFNTLEVWNGFEMNDTDGDGRREITKLDRVMRDWFNFLSMGFTVTPTGNSDSHTAISDTMGMPRTFVRVSDDTAAGLASGTAVDDVMTTLTGARNRDVVLSDAPFLSVTSAGQPAIGAVVDGSGGSVTLTVRVQSPDWAELDTLEVFANETPDTPPAKGAPIALVPVRCWTTRDPASLPATDPCALASLPALPMTIQQVSVGNGFSRWEATVTVTLTAADVAASRAGASGTDAWLVFRARGDKAIFPILFDDVVNGTTLPVLVDGSDAAALDAALRGHGVPATALTAPIYVDFDGGGYRAPFAP
jgi:hypothetical protein